MELFSLVWLALFHATVALQFVVTGQLFSFGRGVQWTNAGRSVCSSDRDCDGTTGEVCWWLYDGCSHGKCMCDPRTHAFDSVRGRCIVVRRLNEICGINDTCADSLSCINGTCRCPHSSSSNADTGFSPSDQLCVQPTDRLIGKPCRQSFTNCYHLSDFGYSASGAECNIITGLCSCKEGYRQEGATCRRLRIKEMGCRDDFDCGGGAFCIDGQCQCPNGYRPVAGNTKCAKKGAVLELPIGQQCDEINEDRYCAHGLACHRCQDETGVRPICIRYFSGFEPDRSAYVSRASRPVVSVFSCVVFVTLTSVAVVFAAAAISVVSSSSSSSQFDRSLLFRLPSPPQRRMLLDVTAR